MEDMLCCKRICFNHKDIRSDYKLNYSETLLKQFGQICKTQLKKTDPYWRRVTYRIMILSHFEALCSYAAGVYTVQLADMPFVYFSFYFPVDSNLWVLWSLIWIYELDFSFVFLQFKHTEKKARVDFSERDSRTGHPGGDIF